jgi:hypothetical protein
MIVHLSRLERKILTYRDFSLTERHAGNMNLRYELCDFAYSKDVN